MGKKIFFKNGTMKTIISKKGYVQVMKGKVLMINTTTDEPIEILIKNDALRNELYCKYVKVTIETISKEEVLENKNTDICC